MDLLPPPLSRRRRAAALVTLLAGLGVFAAVVHHHTPLSSWLVWRYVVVWAGDVLLATASLSLGHVLLGRVLRINLPVGERLFFDFALGLLAFGLGIFGLGMVGLLVPAVFWLWPLAALAVGARELIAYFRRLRRHLRRHLRREGPRVTTLSWLVLAFGLAGVLMIYVNVMTPRNVGYDARWYHFALAEHYVAAGRITRFPEGFFGAVWPHFASWLYTWAFLSKGSLWTQMELAAHVEFAVFVATLAGVPILARWMLHGRRLPLAWTAVFLFPGLFLYDSSLSGTADHVLAFWALALLLALRRVWVAFEWRRGLLFGCFVAAAALTKYQAANVLVFPLAVFLVMACVAAWRARLGGAPSASSVAITVGATGLLVVALWAPHWAKNWLWYGDPVYPFLRGVLTDRPWGPDVLAGFSQGDWRPHGFSWAALGQSLTVLLTFSFAPHDWPRWHGALPVFGCLFTLALAPLAFLPRARRIWLVVACAEAGVFVWFWMVHQDRYLQALLPWMATVVAVVLYRLWQGGRALQAAVAALVALQVVWGGDVYFFPTHAVLWKPPIHAVVELMSGGFDNKGDRFATGNELEPLRGRFPPGSRLLLHESEPRLGGAVQIVTDARGAQAGIDYAAAASPLAIEALLRTMGVTHLAWRADRAPRGEQTLSNEVAFLHFAARHAKVIAQEAGFVVAVLPRGPLPDAPPNVVVGACGGDQLVPLAQLDAWTTDANPGQGTSTPGDVYLVDTRCAEGRVPPGYREAGRFPPYAIAVKATP